MSEKKKAAPDTLRSHIEIPYMGNGSRADITENPKGETQNVEEF